MHFTALEPSCGNGNFIWAILEIKAFAIEKENDETPHGVDFGIRLLQALSSISGSTSAQATSRSVMSGYCATRSDGIDT
ncbi:hypothetical protein FLP41_15290 [Paracoccus marcusii]|uniref:hypothetical protein n=1 Tax=Paracoccus marcusii TaxID=59779 RepID=UPI002ED038B7|nr:hypothetical protein FLP41_15290 [Paracoccus marcusii]